MNGLSALLSLAFLFSEVFLAARRRSSRSVGANPKDSGSLRLLWRVISSAILVGVLISAFSLGPKLPRHVPWRTLVLTLFFCGTVIRWWAITYLGRFFTVDVALVADHRLVDTGPYRWVRHPSYTGLILQFLSLALALNNLLALCVVMIPICLVLHQRIEVEEAVLKANFGENYEKYTSRTQRLVPLVY